MGGTTLAEPDERSGPPASDDATTATGEAERLAGHAPAEDERPGPRRVRLAAALGLAPALLLAALGQTAVVTPLPAIAGALHGTGRAAWAVPAYLLASAVALPLYGRLGDRLGRKPALLLALLVFVAGSALAARAHTMDALLAGRALQGLGAGGILGGAHALATETAQPRARVRATVLTGVTHGLGTLAGPLFGALVTAHASWRWCFAANVPVGLFAFLVVAVALKAPRSARRPGTDPVGVLLLAASFVCVVLLASWAGTEYAWDSRVVLGLGCGALGSALLFVAVEHAVAEPILPPRLLRDRTFLAAGVVGGAAGAALFGAARCLPLFLQGPGGTSATEAGLLLLPMAGGFVLAAAVTGRLTARTGHHKLFPVLGCALAAEGMWLLSHLQEDTARATFALGAGILGLGLGFVLPVLPVAARHAVRPDDGPTPLATGLCARQLGGALGAAALGAVLAARAAPLHAADPAVLGDAVPGLLRHFVPVLVLGLLLACFLKENPLVSHAAHSPHGPLTASDGGGAEAVATVPAARTAPAPAPYTQAGVPVCGTVQHHDGSVVPRAALTLIDVTGRQIGRGATGEDGRYALSTPGTGAYVLIAAAGGHQPQAVTVTVGDRPVDLDVVLGGAGRLAGTVTTADGTPVRDAMVTLTDVRGEVVATTRSGREGGYVINELVAGEYTLASSAPAFRPAALPVTVQASRETRQDVELAGGAVLRGTVRAGGGRPVEDARVTLLDAGGNVVDTATTGPDGLFRFVDMAAGEYTVVASGYPPVATVLQVAGGGRTERDLQLGHED
ncbi:MFS transporter [Streptomyces sp. Ru73]|uniref:MFS transporter n=1 Tax=Streptomyces sp. Ru73 TaxID=2080748 RepID=UPI000CDDB22C|nr:MFS transporter [Streptomyces sp. Ru73]POX38523.1 MFS transporter [Streptomyces sp. Ru73]